MDTIEFVCRRARGGMTVIDPVVNGTSIVDRVVAAHRSLSTSFVPIEAGYVDARHFLDRPTMVIEDVGADTPPAGDGPVEVGAHTGEQHDGVAVAGCSCGGGPGCSGLFVDLVLWPWAVHWERVVLGDGSPLEGVGPFHFNRGRYDDAIERLESDLTHWS